MIRVGDRVRTVRALTSGGSDFLSAGAEGEVVELVCEGKFLVLVGGNPFSFWEDELEFVRRRARRGVRGKLAGVPLGEAGVGQLMSALAARLGVGRASLDAALAPLLD